MRERICLNGEWDFMPVYDNNILYELPKALVYEGKKCLVPSSWRGYIPNFKIDEYSFSPMNVFEYPDKWAEAESGVLHTTFAIPSEMKNERIFLQFNAISQKAIVYLNNKKIATWVDSYLPLIIDITKLALKNGEKNDLHVVCCSFDKVTIPSGIEKSTGLVGTWFGMIARGIWQDVFLVSKPKLYISDLQITTSVRSEKINLYLDIINYLNKQGDLNINVKIKFKETVVKEFNRQIINPAQEIKEFKVEEKWDDAIYWDTENPHLYYMEVSIIKNGFVLDKIIERFGFREFWSEGQNFILNGTRINLRGDSWHFQGAAQQTKQYALNWCRICRENGVNSIRLHGEPHPSYYLDAADEIGILIVDETAIYGSGKTMDASNPDYIQNCRDHIKNFVGRDKNHASVVIWSLQNEMRWVDGRDVYKKYILELMNIFRKNDRSGRLILLDGDNRLIDKEHTEIASLHYNIDGTIDQWDRKTPLTIGEHGGLWYICPQNSSMYMGLDAYLHNEECLKGISLKEQLFMEYARRKEVSGISSFNFAHYFANSMPCNDIDMPVQDLNTPGPKPRKIKKYSLTIDNGFLPKVEYPMYSPNAAFYYAKDGMRPVTILPREYNHSFYDDKPIVRNLDIFNDTLGNKNVRIDVCIKQGEEIIHKETIDLLQFPGEYVTRKIEFMPKKVLYKTTLNFACNLYHGEQLMYSLDKKYYVYPSDIKILAVTDKPVSFFGNKEDFEKLKLLVPNICYLDNIEKLTNQGAILIIGSNISNTEMEMQPKLYEFLHNGGHIIILEQFSFSFGSMTINKKNFLRAHASDYTHPVLKGLNNDDLMYWHEQCYEDGPNPFIYSAFEKPQTGNYNMILECSFGDFGDGGDLWTPLLEYNTKNGTVIANQLDLMSNFDTVPQAAVILRNILSYLSLKETAKTVTTGALICNDFKVKNLLDKTALDYIEVDKNFDLHKLDILIVSSNVLEDFKHEISKFVKKGGTVLILPLDEGNKDSILNIMDNEVNIINMPTYQLKADYSYSETKGISIVDLFGYDKVVMSPRKVTNEKLAHCAVCVKDAIVLMESVEGTIWKDLFVKGNSGEYCKRSLVEINKNLAPTPMPYLIKKNMGKGKIVISQFIIESEYEKSIRFYTRLFANIGTQFLDSQMNIVKGDSQNSVEVMMAQPYLEYQDYDRIVKYYTDPQFSLNNLGEGLYGWMKKYERDIKNGFLKISGSEGKTILMTCFVHSLKNPRDKSEKQDVQNYILNIKSNSKYQLYINGELICGENVVLNVGINRMFILAYVGEEELKIRPIFKNADGSYATNLQYRLTVDEIDPK